MWVGKRVKAEGFEAQIDSDIVIGGVGEKDWGGWQNERLWSRVRHLNLTS